MPTGRTYDWKRFWCPRNGAINLIDGGYLADPDASYSGYLNPTLRTFRDISWLPCLALLGEPGIGKTEAMKADQAAVDAAVAAEGGKTLRLDLRSCGSEQRLVDKLFGDPRFASWMEGNHRLHVFLDSLDECLLRIDTVGALLVDELRDCPVERLSLRIACRTAEWPMLLEEGLRELWPEEGFEAYELAPLRRADIVRAAEAEGIDPEAFLRALDEAGAVPLAIKPVTLSFLTGSYRATGGFATKQADLYEEGCLWLCEERNANRRVGPGRSGGMTPDQRLAVAARIAAVTVYSNKYAVWTGVRPAAPDEEDVLLSTLAGGTEFVGEDEFPVDEAAVREALSSGLFSARGPERLGWAHQTYAEFLAARYLVRRGVANENVMALLVHPEDEEGRLALQLHEAAAWLAGMSIEVFRELTERDPEVLLRSDVASADAEGKAALVGTLLRLYDEERLLDVGMAPRDRYKRMIHPGIAEQLRPYIVDGDKSLSARRVALDIAEACELRFLQEDAAAVALGTDEDLLVRKEAAHFVAVAGDYPTRARLMPLAAGEAGEDPNDDLKGNGLRAVWPENVAAEELFGMLTRPKMANYMGSYRAFLTYDLADSLSTADLPAALAWVEGHDPDHGEPLRFNELADQIMQCAWAELPNPVVAPAFAKAALARLRRHEEVVKERREVFEATGDPTFGKRAAADVRRRRLLLQELIGLLETEHDAFYVARWKTPLITHEDVGWLVDMMRSEASEQRKAVIATLVAQAQWLWDDESEELVYLAHLEDQTLAGEVAGIFSPVELGSEEADEQRRLHERLSQWEKEDEEPLPPEPPVSVRVVNALDEFDAGEVDAYWTGVYELMQYDERGFGSASGAEWDMTALPGWEAADDGTRARIVEASKGWILEGDPRTDEWFGKDKTYRPAFAGYRALCLVLRFAPEFLQGLPADVWEKWTPIILDFPVTLNTEEEKDPHMRLVAMAYDRAPDRFISTLLSLIDHEDAKGPVFVTRGLERCWDGRLARAVLEKAKDPALKPSTFGVLLDELLHYGLPEAREFAESLVASGAQGDDEHRRRAAVAARSLFYSVEDSAWDVLWPAMQADDRFGGDVVDEISSGVRDTGLPYEHLTESQIADFYVWMARRYPRSEYFLGHDGDGFITYGLKENISEWRDGVMQHLRNRGTFEACRQIERIAAELPELQDTLKWTLYQARAEARRRTWLPPEPEHVLKLAARPGTRLVRNGDQLLEVLIESLARLEEKLQGETPMAPALWNQANGSYKPKDENWFSDYVKQHLQEDLRGRGVVLNREVQIREGEGEGRGERTDIHVDAVVPGSNPRVPELVSVIVEAKGCWNSELNTAMEEQLVGRYLEGNNICHHGLYLVGWFNCEQWDEADWRRGRAPRYGIGEARERFAEQARELSEGVPRVRAFVVNAALR